MATDELVLLAEKARTELRVAIGAVNEAMTGLAAAGLDPNAEMMRMMQEAFQEAGQEMPLALKMLLG